MATKRKQVQKASTVRKPSTKRQKSPQVTDDVGNYEKHPFFVRKLNEAKEFIQRVGLPKQLAKKG